jgi:hypothetical protein
MDSIGTFREKGDKCKVKVTSKPLNIARNCDFTFKEMRLNHGETT